jgi:hypothetical protein
LLGAGQHLLAEADPMFHVVVPYDMSASLASARATGDAAAFDRGLAEGHAWTLDQAVAAGLGLSGAPNT